MPMEPKRLRAIAIDVRAGSGIDSADGAEILDMLGKAAKSLAFNPVVREQWKPIAEAIRDDR